MFRAAAAGTTTSASTSSAPIIFRLTRIASVSRIAKTYSRIRRIDPARGRERRAQAVEQQIVVLAEQQERRRQRRRRKQHQIAVGDRQQAAEQNRLDLVDVELPRHRDQQAQAEPERQREEHADQRVVRQLRAPLDVHHRQRRQQAEAEHAAVRRVQRLAEQQPDAHAGDRRLSERGAEKRHPPRDDQVAEAAEQRREQQRRRGTRERETDTRRDRITGARGRRRRSGSPARRSDRRQLARRWVTRSAMRRTCSSRATPSAPSSRPFSDAQRVVEPARRRLRRGRCRARRESAARAADRARWPAARAAARRRTAPTADGGRARPARPVRAAARSACRVALVDAETDRTPLTGEREKIGDRDRQRAIDLKLCGT